MPVLGFQVGLNGRIPANSQLMAKQWGMNLSKQMKTFSIGAYAARTYLNLENFNLQKHWNMGWMTSILLNKSTQIGLQ